MPEWELRWPWQKIIDDPLVREDFLQESQPFIRYVTNQVCHRILDWGRDEELSEALVAFNEAIEHYEEDRGVPFLAYARLLIKRRLIDYYRRQKSREALPLDQEDVGQAVESMWVYTSFVSGNKTKNGPKKFVNLPRFLHSII